MAETIAQIKNSLKAITDPADPRLANWRQDSRTGVQQALQQWDKQQLKLAAKRENFKTRFTFEAQQWDQGLSHVAGVDEVGRGPLAGPVVAAAVILPHDFAELDVIDSKQLSEKMRDHLFDRIIAQALSIGIGVVDAAVIDDINIYEAARSAMTQAVAELVPEPDYLLIDAMTLQTDIPQLSLIKGDARSNSIAAASIIAKVTRDRMMTDYDRQYPGYGFAQHAGYGTKAHLAALAELGVTPIHRRSFGPVKSVIAEKK